MDETWTRFQALKQTFTNTIELQEKKKVLLGIQDEIEPNMKAFSPRDQQFYKQEIGAMKNQITKSTLFPLTFESEFKNQKCSQNNSTNSTVILHSPRQEEEERISDPTLPSPNEITIESVEGNNLNISDLSHRVICITIDLPMLVLKNCHNLKIHSPSSNTITGSFRIENCTYLDISNLSCSQLRLKDGRNILFRNCCFINGGASESCCKIDFVNCTNTERIANFSSPFQTV